MHIQLFVDLKRQTMLPTNGIRELVQTHILFIHHLSLRLQHFMRGVGRFGVVCIRSEVCLVRPCLV